MSTWAESNHATVVYSGTVAGPHHRDGLTPNQDSHAVLEGEDWSLFVVADGAGSLPQAHIGAHLAVTAVVDLRLSDPFSEPHEFIENALQAARESLFTHETYGPKDLGCTLAIVLATKEGWEAAVVGDSFAVLRLQGEETYCLITGNQIGSYANETKLLTSDEPTPIFSSGGTPLAFVAVSSDGLENVALQANEAYGPFWASLEKLMATDDFAIVDFLSWLDSKEKIVDDTTLILSHLREA